LKEAFACDAERAVDTAFGAVNVERHDETARSKLGGPGSELPGRSKLRVASQSRRDRNGSIRAFASSPSGLVGEAEDLREPSCGVIDMTRAEEDVAALVYRGAKNAYQE
jgi:hypothetical protein